jgi:hypothetical protein
MVLLIVVGGILTEENQRHFLSVLEALNFAQSAGEKNEQKNANTGVQEYTD